MLRQGLIPAAPGACSQSRLRRLQERNQPWLSSIIPQWDLAFPPHGKALFGPLLQGCRATAEMCNTVYILLKL